MADTPRFRSFHGHLVLAIAVAGLALSAGATRAAEFQVLLDLDNDGGTGCAFSTFAGIEQVLNTTVVPTGPNSGEVTDVTAQTCTGAVFGAPVDITPPAPAWPVGVDLGDAGADVLETYLPWAQLAIPDPSAIRVIVIATEGQEVDTAGPAVVILAQIVEIPTLGRLPLALLTLLLVGAAILVLRRGGAAVLAILLLLAGGGALWAICVLDGNPTDWAAGNRVYDDPTGDAAPGADLESVWVKRDSCGGVDSLCVRVDGHLTFDPPPLANDDAATVLEDSGPNTIDVMANDIDATPFQISAVTQPANGTVVITNGGDDLTYEPDPNYCNTPPGTALDTFTYTLTPGNDTATVTVTVTCVDDNPTAVDDAATVAEDAPATPIAVLANDTDPESDPFTIASASDPANGTVVLTGGSPGAHTGLTYQPDPGYCNTPPGTALDTFTYTLNPGGSTATVTVTVTCFDDPPTAVNDTLTVNEDAGATTVDVLANDTDPDGGTNTVSAVTQPANGTVVITNGGADLTYQPDADYCNSVSGPTDDFTYTLSPGGSVGTVAVTVTCIDDGATANDDVATVAEDAGATTVDVLANDSDPEGDPFSVTVVQNPSAQGGTVLITNGGADLSYQPAPNYCNTPPGTTLDTFTYTITGGSTATVTVTVTCVDDDPTAVDDAATVNEDSGATTINVQSNDTDPDGGTNTIQSVTQPANGAVVITNGGADLTYAPDPNYCNNPPGTTLDTFTYTLSPGGSVATVTVTVTCIDDNPVAVNDAATVNEDSGANTINVIANDTDLDGGTNTVQAVTQPANGAVVITNGGLDLTYAPNADYCNNPPGTTLDTFTYTLNGGSSATVTVTVTCLNDGPVIDLDQNDDKGTAGSDFALTFTEGDGATLIEDPADAILTDVDSANLASLTVTLTNLLDTGFETLGADTTGTVIVANYTPATGVLALTGSDTVANYQQVLRTVTYVNTDNAPDASAPRSITFVANDGTSNSNTATSTVTVVANDTSPTAVNDSATVNEDSGATTIDVQANDTDPDGGPISITAVTQPSNGTVVITNGGADLTYQPDAEYCNSVSGPNDTFTYTLSPGGSIGTVSVTVTCVDDSPTAVNDATTVNEDSGATTIDVQANDTDADGGTNTINSVTQPANGTVVITNGGADLTYAPNANYCNTPPGTTLDTFTYTLSPGGSVATVTVTVTCVDDNPVAVADAATVNEDSGANTINVLANDTDVDGGTKLVQSVTQPTNGAVVITNGGADLTYAPNANYCNNPPGTTLDTFTYTLTPGGSNTTVTVTVTCIDDPPTAVNDAATVNEDSGANTINVQANDTDPDGGTNLVQSVTQPANGTVVITNGGADLTYAPNANYCNNPPGTTLDTFTYTLTPGGSIGTVTVTVTCVNDPPVADDDAFDFIGNTELRVDTGAVATPHALETTPSTFGVLDGDSDPVENDAIAVTSITVGACTDNTGPTFDCTVAGVGTVNMQANGRFSFIPDPGDTSASETFTYVVSDDGLPAPASDTATVTLTRFERVWYVKNDAAAGGLGRSGDPFDTLAEAQTASLVNDWIFVYFGDGATTGQAGGILLKNGQHLIGEHAGLSIPVNLNGNGSPTSLVAAAAGDRPLLDDTVAGSPEGVAATDAIPTEIVGLNLAGNVNAIDWTTNAAFAGTGTLSILDNVIRSAGADGVDVNLAGTGATRLAFSMNNLTAAGSGLDVQETGTGALTVVSFQDNVVSGDTGGSGIVINAATFDGTPGGAYQQLVGGTTTIGSPGNPVGGAGMVLTGAGDIAFTDLDVFAGGGAAVQLTGTGAVNTGAGSGTRVTVGAGVAIFEATGGPAVSASNATIDLQLSSLTSTNSSSTGVSLTSIADGTTAATFSAPSGSSITNATGTDFVVDGGNATVTYGGTITDDVGQLVSIANTTGDSKSFTGAITDGGDGDGGGILINNNAGSQVSFSGGLTLSTGANNAFVATTNNTGGGPSLTVTGATNTIKTTGGTPLNVTNTIIGASGLNFRCISAGRNDTGGGACNQGGASGAPANGIVLNNTGTLGGLTVSGSGSTVQGGDDSGGTIQNTTSDAVSLTSTRNVSLTNVLIQNVTGGVGSRGIEAVNLAGSNFFRNGKITGLGAGGGADRNGIDIRNTNTNMTLFEINDCVFSNSDSGTSFILAFAQGTSSMRLDVLDSDFSDLVALAVQSSAGNTEDTAHTMTTNITGNTFRNASPADGQGGVAVTNAEQAATHNFTISNNTFIDLIKGIAGGNAEILLAQTTGGALNGTIANNVLGNATAGNGDRRGIGVIVEPDISSNGELGSVDIIIEGNTVDRLPNREAIFIDLREDTQDSELIVRNNIIGQLAGFEGLVGGDLTKLGAQREAIDIQTRGEVTRTLNLLVSGNNVRANTSVNVVNLEVNIDNATPGNLTMHATVTGNTFKNDDPAGSAELIARPRDAGAVTTLCLDMTGNTIDGGAGQIDLNETGVLNVEQASQAALATANGIPAGNVLITGGAPSFAVACSPPPS